MDLMKLLKQIGTDDRGATAVEYGLILSLIVIVSIVAIQAVAGENTKNWDDISSNVATVMQF